MIAASPLRPISELNSDSRLQIGPNIKLDLTAVESVGRRPNADVELSSLAMERMCGSERAFQELLLNGTPIYGTNTGFGPLVAFSVAGESQAACGTGLTAHLGAGCGPAAPRSVVRAAMLIRANSLGQGCSAVRLETVEALLQFLRLGITPVVPAIGSVGASGDLIPLSYIARALCGEGRVDFKGKRCSAATALRKAGLKPIVLAGRDALALTNGTSFLAAYGAMAIARAKRLITRAEKISGWIYRMLGCRASALDPRLHAARGHFGQVVSAISIRLEAGGDGDWEDASRPLQEIYSLRCAPQVLGACRENVKFAKQIVEREINGVSDNPLFFRDSMGAAIVAHGGNFHGQQVAFAADALNAALTQVAVLAERQLAAVLDPRINGGAPPLLAYQPGATSGLAGAQIAATALVAEMRLHNQSIATSSIPTNGGNQDVVSMGATASRHAYRQTDRLASILAILTIALRQLAYLRSSGRAPAGNVEIPSWVPAVEPIVADRPLDRDIRRIRSKWIHE